MPPRFDSNFQFWFFFTNATDQSKERNWANWHGIGRLLPSEVNKIGKNSYITGFGSRAREDTHENVRILKRMVEGIFRLQMVDQYIFTLFFLGRVLRHFCVKNNPSLQFLYNSCLCKPSKKTWNILWQTVNFNCHLPTLPNYDINIYDKAVIIEAPTHL